MPYKTLLSGQVFTFDSVKEVLAKANEEKSGDILAGVAAKSGLERIAAKEVLSQMPLEELRQNPAVPYEEDEVTRLNQDGINETIYSQIKGWTVGDLREWLMEYTTTEEDIRRVSKALTAEMVAAVAKLMTNLDLVYAAAKIRVPAHCNTTIGLRGTLSTRLQPNHTTDNVEGITASLFEGLSYGCGDALIGLNPSGDTVSSLTEILKRFDEVKNQFEIPTQICVLGHITTQLEAVKRGAPADMIFQSIAERRAQAGIRNMGAYMRRISPSPAARRATRPSASPPATSGRPWSCCKSAAPAPAPTSCILRRAKARSFPPTPTTAPTR